jgi:hypothetical protein
MAERDRRVLGALIGVVDHAVRPSRGQRHVQRIEHQLRRQRRAHRPAHDATAEGVEHDHQEEKAGPRRNVGDVGNPQQIGSFCHEIALH